MSLGSNPAYIIFKPIETNLNVNGALDCICSNERMKIFISRKKNLPFSLCGQSTK